MPIGPTFEGDGLAENSYAQRVMDQAGLCPDLLRIGQGLAEVMIELFGDLAPEHALVEEFGFLRSDELREFEQILARAKRVGLDWLHGGDRVRLTGLALKLVAARDRLGLLDEDLRRRIVEARHAFAENLPEEFRDAVEFFDPERYNTAARVEQNILFGTVTAGEAGARESIGAAIGEVLDEFGLRDTVLAVGLDYQVGTGGSRLSPAQRQKLAIARAVLKRPAVLALDEATAVLDPAAESRILAALREEFAGRAIIAALSRPEAGSGFKRVLVLEQGRLVRDGPYQPAKPREAHAPRLAAE